MYIQQGLADVFKIPHAKTKCACSGGLAALFSWHNVKDQTFKNRKNACSGGLAALFSGRNVKPLLIGSSLMLFQQITGQPSVLYYAAKIFKDAGFASDSDATRVSVVLGFFKLVMTGQPLQISHDRSACLKYS